MRKYMNFNEGKKEKYQTFVENVEPIKTKEKKDFERLRGDVGGCGIMLPARSEENLIERIPSFSKYNMLFSARARIGFEETKIILHCPLEKGKIYSKTRQHEYEIRIFCILVESGWIEGDVAPDDYFQKRNKSYTAEDALRLYKSAIQRLGYGAHLNSLLCQEEEFEYDVCTTLGLRTEEKEGEKSSSVLEDAVDFLALAKPAISASVDLEKQNSVPMYDTSIPPQMTNKIVHRDEDSLVHVQTIEKKIQSTDAFSIPIDATQQTSEIKADQAVIHVCGQTSAQAYLMLKISLYDRANDLERQEDLVYFTNKLTRYEISSRALVSRVLDLRAYRQMLIPTAEKHKKIIKYNPRQYVYLSVYVIGKCQIRISVYSKGMIAKEVGPFYLYKGPAIRKGEEVWGCFNKDRAVVDPSSMTSERAEFLLQPPELYANADIFTVFPLALTTTLRELLSPLHKCLNVEVVKCPTHGKLCGVEISHKVHTEVRVPPICYNLQRDLAQYAILWLNSHYAKRDGRWYRIEDLQDQVITVGIGVNKENNNKEKSTTQLLDYSKVFFIK